MTPDHDDFTRLCAMTTRLVLGEGNTALCRQRDALLDRAVDPSAPFTFPDYLKADVEKRLPPEERKAIFQHIWLHEKGDPWLKPEWFDRTQADNPEHEAYWFCAPPEKLFPRLGKLYEDDDNGELLKRCKELGLV